MSAFQQFLIDQYQARIDSEHCLLPEADSASSGVWLAPLSHYGLMSVAGPDAQKFLQGQMTCDFRPVSNTVSTPGGYCTPKGRLLASFHAGALAADHYLLRMRRDIVAPTIEALQKYIVFSKAEMTDDSDKRVVIGIFGENAAELLGKHFGEVPQEQFASHCENDRLLLQQDASGQRFECWLTDSDAIDLWQALSQEATAVSSTAWEEATIRAGVAEICAATRELFVPQVINFELTGGVSFKKGCYTGQEVVARLHYKGTSKRRMYPATLAAPAPAPGTELFSGDKAQSIGHVVNAVAGDADCELLVSLVRDNADSGDIHQAGESANLKISAPPYSLDDN